ncbi:DNA-binding response regulator, NarL/FixJ family, contains REC and HTH domains [Dyadobacter koreensis]|uniref:DNA-binding response regulator, NarL/FixJ family, contains REC and HTH domains n=1 Tax=Dyadobacter koreensis TaxID=408657 RepID=A0A1H6RP19_9BACT|nr:response regulator transcription factor [Dyadobacter koreensis]SEI52942.1 DNA-binding response regulator, NarL/FixJ family, contains REC and HTH domains [Dyadobacter koreensis]
MTRVLLLIKNDFFRLGITASILENVSDASIAETDSWENLQAALKKSYFDILVLDIKLSNLSNLNSFDSIRRIQPNIKILILGEENEKVWAIPYLKKGVDGICLKTVTKFEFQSALSTIIKGKKYIFDRIADFLLEGLMDQNLMTLLSTRESEILQFLLKGSRTAEIAKELKLAPSTISTMKFKIYRKMQVKNVVDLVNKVESY